MGDNSYLRSISAGASGKSMTDLFNAVMTQGEKLSGNFYSGDTPIVINIAGQNVIRTTINDIINSNRITGGNNLNV